MSEITLEPKTALNLDKPVNERWTGFSLAEITGEGFWWLAASPDAAEKLSTQCEKQFGTALPPPGKFTRGQLDKTAVTMLWAGERQWIIAGVMDELPAAISKAGHVTEQSDGWVAFELGGEKTRAVLEKLCQLDLHPNSFPTGSCARMAIEGMIALIACGDAGQARYRLMFQRSCARSMIGHIRHAAFSTCGEKTGPAES